MSILPPAASTPEEHIAQNFGYFAYFLNHPEIGPIIRWAGAARWDTTRLQAELAKTAWWRTTAASARVWEATIAQDPATAQAKRLQMNQLVRTLAGEGGISEAPWLTEISELALRFGWDERQIRTAVAGKIDWYDTGAAANAGELPGSIGETVIAVKQMAAEHFISINDRTAFEWGKAVFSGMMTQDGLLTEIRRQAKSKFTHLADQIDQGFTMRQLFDPYRQEIARTLDMAPESVDFVNDPRWQRVLSVADAQTGKVRPMTLAEASTYARSQPEFAKSRTGRSEAAELSQALAEEMGRAKF